MVHSPLDCIDRLLLYNLNDNRYADLLLRISELQGKTILSKLLWSSYFSSIIIKKAGRATLIFRSPSGFPDSSIHSRSSQQLCRWHHHQHSQYLISSIISIIFDNILLIFISSLSRAQRERMSCLWTRCASSATSPRR